MHGRIFGACALLLASLASPIAADQVTEWNAELLDAIRSTRTPPPRATRAMAIVHVSIHDAASSLDGRYETYADHGAAPEGEVSLEAAIAAAGATALDHLYPGTADALLDAQLAVIADGAAKDAGIAWGTAVAQAIIDLREDDGSALAVSYPVFGGVWWWSPTPPANAPGLLPQWPYVTPWTMTSGSNFRSAGPPPTPTERAYHQSFIEVKRLGRATGSQRTEDQTEIAKFWDDGAGTNTPPGHWMEIAQGLVAENHLDLVDSARTMALVAMTVADAAIAAWDNKYHFHHWRPVTAIREAGNDGNDNTSPDAAWSSLLTTPPFPTYTSGHSTFSGSSSRILAHLFGDASPFEIGSDGLPGVTRSFDSLSEAAEEAGQSRIYGGIHWQYDNRDALAGGRALADQVYANFLRPANPPPAPPCGTAGTTLCLGGRFALDVDWRTGAAGPVGVGTATALNATSGVFSFFEEDNAELLVKVLDGCGVNGHWWVFSAAATDVEYILRVTDTTTSTTRTFFNALGSTGRAITEIEAFPCD